MTSRYLPDLPSSFDPAVYLHSDPAPPSDAPDTFFSDDLEAFHSQQQAVLLQKNKERIVVQHRSWNLAEVFRSEEDHLIATPSKHNTETALRAPAACNSISQPTMPSSPPLPDMAQPSSPFMNPLASSPAPQSPRKRKVASPARDPLGQIDANKGPKLVGGFIMGDSDDEDDFEAIKTASAKRPKLQHPVDVPTLPKTDSLASLPEPTIIETHGRTCKELSSSQGPNRTLLQPIIMKACSGRNYYVAPKPEVPILSYEQLVAARSAKVSGKAQKSYYGIDIHQLMDEAALVGLEAKERAKIAIQGSSEFQLEQPTDKRGKTLMWTEKYRARKFTDLVGDERTHRLVLHWLKSWDSIVFPGSSRPKAKVHREDVQSDEKRHRKILLLTGPPGLGKTTLAHVCAKQAGYEVQEINASDERSRDVVRGRIRDMVGTENVRGTDVRTSEGKVRKAGRPVCVVVDEVDGVVGGNSGGGGEGGFVKALIDLVLLDQKNSNAVVPQTSAPSSKRKKGDKFRLLRPLILICNDVYHPSLRPLRQSTFAEIVHVRRPPLNMVVSRMQSIFEKEGVPCESDGVRRLCEATWGVSGRKEVNAGSGTGEGDIRSVMVVGEWVAGKLRASNKAIVADPERLTRRWFERNVLSDLAHGGGSARSLGRGGVKEVVERVFLEGAGFPKSLSPQETRAMPSATGTTGAVGVAEAAKRRTMDRLREMIDMSGDSDKIISDCFTTYPAQPFQDDTYLSKPVAAYDWLYFHDALSSAVHSSQEWELAPYLSQSVLAFHQLFASPASARKTYGDSSNPKGRIYGGPAGQAEDDPEILPFTGPSASYQASEALKSNNAALSSLQSSLSLPLARIYRSTADVATELLPYTLRMLAPEIKPVIINSGSTSSSSSTGKTFSTSTASVRKASEKVLVERSVRAMMATGVRFERTRVEVEQRFGASAAGGGWVFRMEPPLDEMASFKTGGKALEGSKERFAVRQVLEGEWKKEEKRMGEATRARRGGVEDVALEVEEDTGEAHEKRKLSLAAKAVKRDFFGRIIISKPDALENSTGGGGKEKARQAEKEGDQGRVWVTFHEGYSNAVRKPVTVNEFMAGL
ncbi:hypothetical protein K402DRAFT_458710 [Aulographum hederae CBS 113979]|uniref:AAA+ ATPase domain-containing protein n=1 Tax=Aulographum hederae CBS 113979 TaxID=1176131 RepID=A0A6G1HGX3_9PEZI|nr:hypothetical protein K402DRAFT_458710 [Aulographum hederae CBS 113979]